MARRPRQNPRLQDRDYELLEHVDRYHLSTPEILHRLFFADSDRNAVTKVTSRLCADEFLCSHPLYGSNVYFTLGRRGAKSFGLAARRVGAIKPQPLYRDFGVLYFCCRGNVRREKLRFCDIQKEHSEIIGPGLDSSHYYIDQDAGTTRLAYIWVEGAGTTTHITNKIKQDIVGQRRGIPKLRQLIDEGKFAVAIVTISEEKRAAIVDALQRLPTTVAFRVESVPELIHLLR